MRAERSAARNGAGPDGEIVVVGAGAAGLALAWRVACAPPQAGGRPLDVVLLEPPPGPARTAPRTWCFWEDGPGEFDDMLTASWTRLSVTDARGRDITGECGAAYKMLRSEDYTRRMTRLLEQSGRMRRVAGTATAVHDVPGGAEVAAVDAAGRPFRLRARWVFDSRPPRRLPPARTTLLQHFRGWFVRTARPCFDPSLAQLMDLRVRQPSCGVAFVYLLPLAADEALVEYTVFSPSLPAPDEYDRALRRYLRDIRPLGAYEVTAAEQGVIPMTDGHFPRRAGRSVFRVGAAGGATRPSTGYTFAALQRQTASVAAALRTGGDPLPPDPHRGRHRVMDAVWLRALAAGRIDGSDFFADLFRRNRPADVVRFLDGRSTLAGECVMGLRTPVVPMLRTLGSLPFVRRGPEMRPPVLPTLPGGASGTGADGTAEGEGAVAAERPGAAEDGSAALTAAPREPGRGTQRPRGAEPGPAALPRRGEGQR